MALTPSTTSSANDKRAKREASEQDALLREVDEAVRQDQFANFAQNYGKLVIGVVLVGLLAFGGWLWWHSHQEKTLEVTSEELVKATDELDAGNLDQASKALGGLDTSSSDGAETVAALMKAGIAFKQNKPDEAAKLYGEVAADDNTPKPYRDFATLRQVSIGYGKMKPADVVAKLKPLAVPGAPYFGSAGELLGAAYLDQGKPELAGPLFAAIAKDKDVPESLRSRARQLAGLMGVDAIDDVDKTLDELRAEQPQAPAQ